MSKLNQGKASGAGPLATETRPSGKTFEGGAGFTRVEQSELFLRATTMFAGEKAFYETGQVADVRCRELIRKLAVENWQWVADFLPWLRLGGNIRTMSIMLAAEAVHARLQAGYPGMRQRPGPRGGEYGLVTMTNRQLIAAVLQRGDEPGEMVQYWSARFGKNIPKPVKRGVADAVTRLWNETSTLRWDKPERPMRFADILELCHPKPKSTTADIIVGGMSVGNLTAPDFNQQMLFNHLITARKHRKGYEPPIALHAIRERWDLNRCDVKERHAIAARALNRNALAEAQIRLASAGQHEWLMSWLGPTPRDGTGLTKRQQWNLIIPHMGYMAVLRHLRDFDECGLGASMVNKLTHRIADPGEVAASRQLPFRFLSAYLNIPSLRWGQALEQALQACVPNIPTLDGRTLVLIDMSGSMMEPFSQGPRTPHGKRPAMLHVAELFGVALALRNPQTTDVWGFADTQMRIGNITQGGSILKTVELITSHSTKIGLGTAIEYAVRETYDGHDRVVILSDMQTMPSDMVRPEYREYYRPGREVGDINAALPADVHVFGFNLAGYTHTAMVSGSPYRHELGGLTDHTFATIPMLESGKAGQWAWNLAAPVQDDEE